MSKLTLIENALRAMDPASFQRLCDSYLHARGYEDRINPIGLVIGADKVAQGTPDTLIIRPDGKYIFAEYSTQQEGLAEKFARDLAKCFDEDKTGIPVDRIHEIVLCHNSRLSTEEEHGLAEECRRRGVLLSTYGPGTIAHDLYQKYPGLARDFLGIEVDTGQIVSTEEFVAAYNKGAFATPLDITFRFREDEVAQVLAALESGDLALIAGHAGIGKTRLALECCRRYAEAHPDAQIRCIFFRGPDIFQDLRVHFSAPGHYLILVDDANRVNKFEYALQLLHDQRPDQKIKIIATVRDYALDSALKATHPYGDGTLIKLSILNEEQIKELARERGINHHLYLERIVEIANGNPRLAVMAASVAAREDTLQSIADVSALYDEYFSSISEDLKDIHNTTLLQVAAIIAFFRVVDRSSAELMGAITDAFGIDLDAFWQAAHRLHEMELVNMHEDEAVRVSDQVLSTYLFYLAVFREQVLDLTALLEHFFPRLRHKLIDVLNPILSVFNTEFIKERLRPHVDRAWRMFEQRDDEVSLMNLIEVFWFVKPTDALVYVAHRISMLELETRSIEDLTFVTSAQVPPTASILGILDNFSHTEEPTLRVALNLLLDYLERRPSEVSLVLRILLEKYGISHRSQFFGFYVERVTTEVLWEKAHDGENELISRVFLVVAERLLQTHFQTHEPKSDLAINIFKFDAPATPEFLDLRRSLWQRLFVLYRIPTLQEHVLELFRKHSRSGYLVANKDIVVHDAAEVQAFFKSSLDPSEYRHCVVVHDYLEMLERVGVEIDEDLRDSFTNETFALSELLFEDRQERRALGRQEYQAVRRERLAAYTEGFTQENYDTFFERCDEIYRDADSRQYEYQIQNSISEVLLQLAERDVALFESVLARRLHAGSELNLDSWRLAAKFIEVSGPKRAYEILSTGDYPGKMLWLSAYFMHLPPEAVTTEVLGRLYELYETASWRDLQRGMDYLLKYETVDPAVVIMVTRTLVTRAADDPDFGLVLSDLFSGGPELEDHLREIFAGEVELLKRAYLAACAAETHTDYDGASFNILLDLDHNFAREWVANMFAGRNWVSRHDDSRDYTFIWQQDDHRAVAEQIVDAVHVEGRGVFYSGSYLRNFFILREGAENVQELWDRQDAFFDAMIEERHSDHDYIQTLFAVICNLSPERRRGRIATFLFYNQDFDAFNALPLEPTEAAWSGSAVPMLQGQVDYLESLLPLVGSVELLRHRQKIEHMIQNLREDIEREKKRDFMRDR